MIRLGEVVIIGGGCYGSFYLGQLVRARAADAATWERLVVVDRDPACAAAAALPTVPGASLVVASWRPFLDGWLADPARGADDHVVPSPLMPHLFADWVRDRARDRWPDHRIEMVPVADPIGTPYDQLHPGDGNRYVSHADWICPVHCIEPATCPKTRAPRSWEMADTVAAWAARRGTASTVGLFTCRHVTHGVGMVPAHQLLAAAEGLDDALARTGSAEVVLASISSCHGAVGLLRAEAP